MPDSGTSARMAKSETDLKESRSPALAITWSRDYHSDWDARPEAYIEHGLVACGRSRRLARAEDRAVAFKAYVGVQHDDPARWHLPGQDRSVFFLSLFIANRTVSLRTYSTMVEACTALRSFHAALRPA